MIETRRASPSDFAAAASLLDGSRLPLEGLREHFDGAIVAVEDGRIVGCVALERYGESALLRSLVVAPERRGERLGERLASEALGAARAAGVRDVYLLTETAGAFFPRFGFVAEERSLAPARIAGSIEFRRACPAGALMMHARLS